MVKLESKHIKSKLKAKFGSFEVYNPIKKELYGELSEMIKNNSKKVDVGNGKTDLQVDNTVEIIRKMLISLTNIESAEYWNGFGNIELKDMLDLADGDFKSVVNTLINVMLEIAQDARMEDIRKLQIVKDKITELTEIFKFDADVSAKLAELGLDKESLDKIQNGDQEAIKKLQDKLVEEANKSKGNRKTRRSKK